MREPQNNDQFPLTEYESRIARLRAEMKAEGMDAMLASTEANVVYFTGFLNGYWICTMHDDSQLALITADPADEPMLFIPDHLEQTARTGCVSDLRVWSQFSGGKSKGSVATVMDGFIERKLKNARVGIEIGPHDRPGMSLPYFGELRDALPGVEWVECTDIMTRIRKVKSPLEIEKTKIACNVTCQAVQVGMDAIREGMSEKELGQIIAMEMVRQSPDACVNNPWFIMVHSSGRGISAYDGIPSSYRFKKGETVYVDTGFVYQGYRSDMIRCAVLGKPSEEQEKYYYACRDANMAALRYVKPGVRAKDIYEFWANTAAELGFADSIKGQQDADWDFLGHGLGLTTHELPLLNSTCEEEIVPGMVMSLEGNVFDKFPFSLTKYALKNEENVLVTENGSEWLTPLSNDLWIVDA